MPAISKNISRTIFTCSHAGITFGDVIYEPRGQYGPLVQEDFQLVLLIDGGLDLRRDGKWLRVSEGQVVLCQPGDDLLYLFEREHRTRHQWCTVASSQLGPSLKKKFKGQGSIVAIPEIMHTVLRAGLQNNGDSKLHLPLHQSLAEAAFHSFFVESSVGPREKTSATESVLRVQRFIHENYARELSLPDLAKQGAVSPNHLIRLFREKLSITPMDYLWNLRVEQGAAWLRETGLGISEIAFRAGFQNVFHFSRRIKQRYGKSPRSYRERK